MKDKQIRQNERNFLQEKLIQINEIMNQGELKQAFKIVLELEKNDMLTTQELLSCKLYKADLLYKLGDFLDAIKIAENIYQEFQKHGDLLSSFDALIIQAYANSMMGNVSQSEEMIKTAEDLFKKIKKNFAIDLRERESFLVRIKANNHYFKGEIQSTLDLNKKAYELAKDTGNKALISASLNNIADKYLLMKEYDKAIMYTKEAIKIDHKPSLIYSWGTLMEIYIKMGNIKEAKVYFGQMRKLKNEVDIKGLKHIYHFEKALILKSSLRARDRIKSEDLFKELTFDDTIVIDHRIRAIINLCDLLLTELRITNDTELIDEIQPYIQKLLVIAEHEHMYLLLAETYLLQAKLSLLTSNIKKAQRFLTQAQKISERFGYKELAEKISNEKSKLLNQSEIWEKLKKMGVPMVERIKMAQLKEQIEEIIEKQTLLPTFIIEEEVAIHEEKKICLVCRGEVLKFSYICKCGAIYCDNCARALIDLENVCWACNVPIDHSKPIKPYTEKKIVEIDKETKSK